MIRLLIPPLLFPYLIQFFLGSYSKAAFSSLLVLVALCYGHLRKGFVIEWSVAVCFAFIGIFSLCQPYGFDIVYFKILIYGTLSLIGWLSLAIKSPFALQYAKQETSEEYWNTHAFLHINRSITVLWSIVFSFNFIWSVLAMAFFNYWPIFLLLSYGGILLALVFTERYPNSYLASLENAHAI